jgi:hypothetical protein
MRKTIQVVISFFILSSLFSFESWSVNYTRIEKDIITLNDHRRNIREIYNFYLELSLDNVRKHNYEFHKDDFYKDLADDAYHATKLFIEILEIVSTCHCNDPTGINIVNITLRGREKEVGMALNSLETSIELNTQYKLRYKLEELASIRQ